MPGVGSFLLCCCCWQHTSLGVRLSVTRLKEGRRSHGGKVRPQEPIISTVLPFNIQRLSWNACWQLAAADLLTPTHAIYQHSVQHSKYLRAPESKRCSQERSKCKLTFFLKTNNCIGKAQRASSCSAVMLPGMKEALCISLSHVEYVFPGYRKTLLLLDALTAHARCDHRHMLWPKKYAKNVYQSRKNVSRLFR